MYCVFAEWENGGDWLRMRRLKISDFILVRSWVENETRRENELTPLVSNHPS
jgi:hypothetical protein